MMLQLMLASAAIRGAVAGFEGLQRWADSVDSGESYDPQAEAERRALQEQIEQEIRRSRMVMENPSAFPPEMVDHARQVTADAAKAEAAEAEVRDQERREAADRAERQRLEMERLARGRRNAEPQQVRDRAELSAAERIERATIHDWDPRLDPNPTLLSNGLSESSAPSSFRTPEVRSERLLARSERWARTGKGLRKLNWMVLVYGLLMTTFWGVVLDTSNVFLWWLGVVVIAIAIGWLSGWFRRRGEESTRLNELPTHDKTWVLDSETTQVARHWWIYADRGDIRDSAAIVERELEQVHDLMLAATVPEKHRNYRRLVSPKVKDLSRLSGSQLESQLRDHLARLQLLAEAATCYAANALLRDQAEERIRHENQFDEDQLVLQSVVAAMLETYERYHEDALLAGRADGLPEPELAQWGEGLGELQFLDSEPFLPPDACNALERHRSCESPVHGEAMASYSGQISSLSSALQRTQEALTRRDQYEIKADELRTEYDTRLIAQVVADAYTRNRTAAEALRRP